MDVCFSDIDETGSFTSGLNMPSIGDPLMQSDLSLAPSLSLFEEEASLKESLPFVSKHFKESSPEEESDEDKLAEGLSFPDFQETVAAEIDSAVGQKSTLETVTDGTKIVLDQLQQNIPVASQLIQHGASTIVSTAFSGISALSDAVMGTASSGHNPNNSSNLKASIPADDELETIDKDFEFLNEEELVGAEEELTRK